MSFYLDAFLFFAVGILLYLLTSWIKRVYLPNWNPRNTLILGAIVTIIFGGMSVLLYLDDNGTSPIFTFLKLILQIQDPNGAYTMLHTNATGVTKADMPWPLVVLLYVLYPVWVYLGFGTAANVSQVSQPRQPSEEVVLKRAAALLGLSIGGILMLFGLVRFPGSLLRQSNLTAFLLTLLGIGIILLSTYGVTMPSKRAEAVSMAHSA